MALIGAVASKHFNYDTLGYTYHWTLIVVILVSLDCKRCRLARHMPKTILNQEYFNWAPFRLHFGSVETLKYKPTKSVLRSHHVSLEAFGGPGYFHVPSQASRNAWILKTQSTAQVYDLTSDRFWLNLAIVKNSQLSRDRSPAIILPKLLCLFKRCSYIDITNRDHSLHWGILRWLMSELICNLNLVSHHLLLRYLLGLRQSVNTHESRIPGALVDLPQKESSCFPLWFRTCKKDNLTKS